MSRVLTPSRKVVAWLVTVLFVTTVSLGACADEPLGVDGSTRGWISGAGLGLFSLVYAACGLAGYLGLEEGEDEAGPLLLPVVGPIVTTATADTTPEGDAVLYTLAGLQASGLLVFGLSFLGDDDATVEQEVSLRPLASPSAAGLHLSVTF